jgi:dolichol kinase
MFLVPSSNPSGASVIGVLFFSLLLAAWYQEKNKNRSYGHLLAMVISLIISCGSRPDNFIFIFVIWFLLDAGFY